METDVIIVGAGAAGLSAAKELARSGRPFILIEGSDRIGGRAFSERIAPDVWFDRGCSWLVGGAANPFVPIADALGIALCKDKSHLFERQGHRFQRNRRPLSPAERAACLRHYDDSDRAILASAAAGQDRAVGDVIDAGAEFAPPYMGSLSCSWGLDADRLSTADFASATGGLGYQAYAGYGNLVATWGADVAVTLGCRAEQITLTPQGVTVQTAQGPIQGRAVILTVSTGVLAADTIRFAPELPAWKAAAIAALPMGTENKFGLHFARDVFGPEGRGYFSTWNDDGGKAKIDVNVMGFNTAVVFVGGRNALRLEGESQAAVQDYALDRVADIFGNDIRTHVTRCIATAWSTVPWARGSWACAQPGQAHQRAELARPVEDRLFFAGEATLYGGQGTCNGAYESGIRAAREASAALAKGS